MIKITCSKCGKKLEAPEGPVGKHGKCPDCGQVFPLPGRHSGPTGREEERLLGKPGMVGFKCSGCGKLLEFQIRLAGQDGKCPGCGTLFRIPVKGEELTDKDGGRCLGFSVSCGVCGKRYDYSEKECPHCAGTKPEEQKKNKQKRVSAEESPALTASIQSAEKEPVVSTPADAVKKCPYCLEPIKVGALKCRFCGEFMQAKSEPEKAQTVVKARLKKQREFAGTGCLLQAAGIALLFFFPVGTFLGLALIVYGGAKSRFLVCGRCGARPGEKTLKLCPLCRAQFIQPSMSAAQQKRHTVFSRRRKPRSDSIE